MPRTDQVTTSICPPNEIVLKSLSQLNEHRSKVLDELTGDWHHRDDKIITNTEDNLDVTVSVEVLVSNEKINNRICYFILEVCIINVLVALLFSTRRSNASAVLAVRILSVGLTSYTMSVLTFSKDQLTYILHITTFKCHKQPNII